MTYPIQFPDPYAQAGIPRPPADIPFLATRSKSGVTHQGINPEFSKRLERAIKDAEAATGSKAQINDLVRSRELQAKYYNDYRSGRGGLAAPPGQSRHDPSRGAAADISSGPVLSWLHKNADKYGLEFLKGRAFALDPVHIQMAGGGHMMPPAESVPTPRPSPFPDPTAAPPMGGAPTPPPGPMSPGPQYAGVPAGMPLMPPQEPMAPTPAPTMMADAGGTMPPLFGGDGSGGVGGMFGGLFGGGGGGSAPQAPQAPAAPPPPAIDPMVLALLAQQGPFKFSQYS
jgi:hypothetical protein